MSDSESPSPSGDDPSDAWVMQTFGFDVAAQKPINVKPLTGAMAERGAALEAAMAKDRLGTGSQAAFEERRAGKILTGMESATREGQQDYNTKMNEKRPLSHAVSGHGKGTDQIGRVVHGHRADEMAEDQAGGTAPADFVQLTGNPDGIARTATPAYDKVGTDPSNVSGAFTSNKGMLHVVGEAFAQADMVSRHAESERAAGNESTIDQRRFVTGVDGPGESIGYNLEVEGASQQKAGEKLAKDEITQRFKSVKRTDGLNSAQVVLDPVYKTKKVVETDESGVAHEKHVQGERVGWQLQTAYATDGQGEKGYANPDEVAGGKHELEGQRKQDADAAKKAGDALAEAQKALKDTDGQIAGKQQTISDLQDVMDAGVPDDEGVESLTQKHGEAQAALEAHDEAMDAIKPPMNLFGGDDDDEPPELDDEDKEKLAKLEKARPDLAAKVKELEDWKEAKEREPERQKRLDELTEEMDALEAGKADKQKAVGDAQGVADEADQTAAASERAYAEATAKDQPSGPSKPAPVTAGYDPGSGQYTGDRPEKPASLKGVDEEGDSLTAHHLYPWNKIRDDLNKALTGKSESAMKKLFAFGKVSADGGFWEELKKEPAERSYKFSEVINKAAQSICWAEGNVFMGPLGSKRGDDPGEEVDAAFTKSGLPTPASAMAEIAGKRGGLGAAVPDAPEGTAKPVGKRDPNSKLSEILERNLQQAQEDNAGARPYDQTEWAAGKGGKKVRKGRVEDADPVAKKAMDEFETAAAELDGEIAAAGEALDDAIKSPGQPKSILESARDSLDAVRRQLVKYKLNAKLANARPEMATTIAELKAQKLQEAKDKLAEMAAQLKK